jgi:hypothetical protein
MVSMTVTPDAAPGILRSAEFWAALFGALTAFLLEAIRRWRSERRRDIAIGNQALVVFMQMYTTLSELQRLIEERTNLIQKRESRAPHYFEYQAMGLVWNESMRLPMDRLGFLLQSYDPDLLNRMIHVENSFFTILYNLERRTAAQMEFTAKVQQIFGVNLPPPTDLERGVGPGIAMRLEQLTTSLIQKLPETIEQIPKVGRQLSETLSFVFPMLPPIGSDFTLHKFTTDPPPDTEPPRWRRSLRDTARWIKRKVKTATTHEE